MASGSAFHQSRPRDSLRSAPTLRCSLRRAKGRGRRHGAWPQRPTDSLRCARRSGGAVRLRDAYGASSPTELIAPLSSRSPVLPGGYRAARCRCGGGVPQRRRRSAAVTATAHTRRGGGPGGPGGRGQGSESQRDGIGPASRPTQAAWLWSGVATPSTAVTAAGHARRLGCGLPVAAAIAVGVCCGGANRRTQRRPDIAAPIANLRRFVSPICILDRARSGSGSVCMSNPWYAGEPLRGSSAWVWRLGLARTVRPGQPGRCCHAGDAGRARLDACRVRS